MNIKELATPCFLVNLDILEENIDRFQKISAENKTQLWPMLKTHKSTEITRMQMEAGATGVLTGTLDEAEAVVEKAGVKKVMLAYPVLGEANINRIIELKKKAEVYIALDGIEAANEISTLLGDEEIKYLIIFDSGLGRFGVSSEMAPSLVKEIGQFSNLKFAGICTHTGQVYGVSGSDEVPGIVKTEIEITKDIVKNLEEAGFKPEIVATGTTPTFFEAVKEESINATRPGNYVFFDAIQIALGAATMEDCSLTVMATIVSHPKEDLFILDCGSKCLGLDKGAHGASLTEGFGMVKGHPELLMAGLSEEVAKVKITGKTNLKIGDRIEIIPNHSCSAANMTSYLTGHRGGEIERLIEVDIRGNSNKPKVL
ncbi:MULTISPECIES: alanine racemase [Psychrilyobacter]|uniref:Amino-acid racemase n=1 Tax=Psychrilyobacter piezotolerans TaxID=2293438 RepID=A0ABX9KJ02_9FUSO|nr:MULTISPECIES: alanine racemase [Psychrilyobacter]MCS5421740.1 alanine racemase [Psychrilyobacter sp. S5]NDI77176.1 amino-acid racemase [Psychrilyobacter piezotolerans]RDE64168.1 amino-acid racemase [Psychrilyobacter sp. S5]REI42260.1 amino-acid racemase [Psychrilyobacter piezotolerans]